jgi:hypothetical protein
MQDIVSWFDLGGSIAGILTSVVAVMAYGVFRFERYKKRRALERFLEQEKPEKRGPHDPGRRTLLHVSVEVGMTEAEVLDAAFRSKKIKRFLRHDKGTGLANGIFLEFVRSSQAAGPNHANSKGSDNA